MEIVNRVLIEDKIFGMFEEVFTKLDAKFNRDYTELRNLSIKYTEMYHDLNKNLIPQINSLDDNFHKPTTSANTNIILNTPNKVEGNMVNLNDRSKTPIKNIAIPKGTNVMNKTPNEENKFVNKKENHATPIKNDRSKTPVIMDNKSNQKINTNTGVRTERSKLATNIVSTKIIGSIQNVTIKEMADKEIGKRKSMQSEGEKERINVSGTNYFENSASKPNESCYNNRDKSTKDDDKSTSEFHGAEVIKERADSLTKRSQSKSKVAIPNTILRSRDLTPLPIKRKLSNLLDISGDISKNENKIKDINHNKHNIPNKKPSENARNNSKITTGNNSKPDNSLINNKRNSAKTQEIQDLKSRRSKDRLVNQKEDWENKRNESNVKRDSTADALTTREYVREVIEVPMKKKENVFSNNSTECLFILSTSE